MKIKDILPEYSKENKNKQILELKNEIKKIEKQIKERENYFRNSIDKIEKEYIEVNQINVKFKKILRYYEHKEN